MCKGSGASPIHLMCYISIAAKYISIRAVINTGPPLHREHLHMYIFIAWNMIFYKQLLLAFLLVYPLTCALIYTTFAWMHVVRSL